MQYKNYNIDLYCSALNEDIGKINVLYNNLESTYGEIINNSDISFNWEGSVKDTFSVKIDNFKSGYNDLYKEKSNLKSISDLMERLKKKFLEYKGIETQLQQSYREKTFVESQLRLTGIDQEGMDKLNQVKNSITNSINTNNNTKNQLSIEIDSLINKLNSIKFSEMYVEKEVESQVASGFETGTRDGTEYGGRGNKIDDQESTSETVVEETRTQSMEALYEIIKYKYKTEMAGGDINTIYNTHEEAVLDYMSQGMTREEAIEFVNNPGYSIRWVVGPEGKGIFTSEEDMMSYLKTDELLGISLKDKTVEQYIEENKQNYQNIPLIAAMGMGVVQSTSTSTPTPTVTSTVTATPTLTPTPMIEDETPSLITLEQPYKDSLEVNMPEENNFVQNNSGYFINADDLTRNNAKDFNDIFYNKFELPIEERISLLKNQKNDLIIQEVELGTISASISGPNSSQQPIATPTIQGEKIVNDSSDTLSIRNKIERLELAINQQEALLKETRDLNRNGGWFGKDGDIRLLAVKRDKTSDPTKISYYNEQIEKEVESFNSRISSQEFIPIDDLLNSNNI